jgi:hypothetical protein
LPILYFAFPDNNDAPAEFSQRHVMLSVAQNIVLEFRKPPITPVCGRCAIFASFVPMPKAAVNENHGLVFGEHYIGLAGKIPAVNPETETEPV